MMNNIFIKEDDYSDIDKIEEYNNEYLSIYPDFKPFVTKENFDDFLKKVGDSKKGNNESGVKEIFYFAIEDNKIVGHGSIRLNPENNKDYSIYGHIMYGVVPSKRNKGYGTIICKLLIERAKEYGIDNVIITCNNIASAKVIEKNNGVLFESTKDDENNTINRYLVK